MTPMAEYMLNIEKALGLVPGTSNIARLLARIYSSVSVGIRPTSPSCILLTARKKD